MAAKPNVKIAVMCMLRLDCDGGVVGGRYMSFGLPMRGVVGRPRGACD